MICSMTGFGRAETQYAQRKIAVELRSVNHRFFECTIRAPRILHAWEAEFRTIIREYASRGKIDVYISIESEEDADASIHLNEKLAGEIMAHAKTLEEAFSLTNDMTVSRLLSMPDVLRVENTDPDGTALKNEVEQVIRQAAAQFRQMRETEGARLRLDLLEKIGTLGGMVDRIVAEEPRILSAYREKLQERVQELLSDAQIEESRLATEIVLYADKISTDEETVRLKSHLQQLQEALDAEDGTGRKMDFLIQELNREANTILSKAGSLDVADLGISLKTEIEKIREQVQNIE